MTLIYQGIIGLFLITSLVFIKKGNSNSSLILWAGLLLSQILAFLPSTLDIGYYLYGGLLCAAIIKDITGKEKENGQRLILAVFLSLSLICFVVGLLGLPGLGITNLLLLGSFGLFIYFLYNYKKYQDDLLYITLIAGIVTTQIVSHILESFN